MPFCPACGAPVEGPYCAKCGTEVGTNASSAPPPPSGTVARGLDENVASALCYILGIVTGVLFLVLSPYNRNRNIRFHAWQSIFLHSVVLVVFWAIMPLLPWGIAMTLGPILGLGVTILWLLLMWKTYKNQRIVIPVIGELAAKQS